MGVGRGESGVSDIFNMKPNLKKKIFKGGGGGARGG